MAVTNHSFKLTFWAFKILEKIDYFSMTFQKIRDDNLLGKHDIGKFKVYIFIPVRILLSRK